MILMIEEVIGSTVLIRQVEISVETLNLSARACARLFCYLHNVSFATYIAVTCYLHSGYMVLQTSLFCHPQMKDFYQ